MPQKVPVTSAPWYNKVAPIMSMKKMLKKIRRMAPTTRIHRIRVSDPNMPWTNIHSSLKMGTIRNSFATRIKRKMRKTTSPRSKGCPIPAGSSTQRVKTPVTHTSRKSMKFQASNTQMMPKARTRRRNSTTNSVVKKFSNWSTSGGFSWPSLYFAPDPIVYALMQIISPKKRSKPRDSTIRCTRPFFRMPSDCSYCWNRFFMSHSRNFTSGRYQGAPVAMYCATPCCPRINSA
mmetsp:Transcript_16349/g.40353  ORF Transcript_16349/g.40353 Transcript_16349/m.40353 type:complete len:233 (+) Transcript_16349:1343-2041(+)